MRKDVINCLVCSGILFILEYVVMIYYMIVYVYIIMFVFDGDWLLCIFSGLGDCFVFVFGLERGRVDIL